jgi:hypothetical protein
MADIAKSGTPSPATLLPPACMQDKGIAGEDIAAGDTLYRKASDGLIYKAGGATNDERYKFIGLAAAAASSGSAVTAFHGIRFRYGAGMTIGTNVMMAPVNAGLVADANAVNGKIIGRVYSATDIYIFPLSA